MAYQVTKSESAGAGLINVRPGKVLADDLKSLNKDWFGSRLQVWVVGRFNKVVQNASASTV